MLKQTRETVGLSEAGVRLAVALADAAENAGALARVAPEARRELRLAGLHLVAASRAVTEAVEVLSGDRQPDDRQPAGVVH